jgi:hypothetical protein
VRTLPIARGVLEFKAATKEIRLMRSTNCWSADLLLILTAVAACTVS